MPKSVHVNSAAEVKDVTMTGILSTDAKKNPSTAGALPGDNSYEQGASPYRHNARKCILHLFSGPAERMDGFAKHLEALQADCVEYDVVNGEEQDLVSDEVWRAVIRDIRDGQYDGMLAGPPCNTYTNARKDDGIGPLPLRGPSGADRYGLPKLSPTDKEKVKIGALLAVRAAEAAEAFHEIQRPFIIEQWKADQTSVSMFNLDEFQQLLKHDDVLRACMDQCMYEAKTAKPTSLLRYKIEEDLTVKCNHAKKMWTKPSTGERTWSSRPPLVGKEWYIDSKEWHRGLLLKMWEAKEKFKYEPYI